MNSFSYGIIFLTLMACNADESKNNVSDTSNPSDTSILTLTEAGSAFSKTLWTSGIFIAQIEGDSMLGTIEYEEYWEGASPHCTTTLQVTGSSSDTACDDVAPDNDWCYIYTLEASAPPADCLFLNREIALNLAQEDAVGFFSFTTEGEDSWGDPMTNQLDYGYFESYGSSWRSESWNGTLPNLDVHLGESGVAVPLHFQTCDSEEYIGLQVLSVDEFSDSNELECDIWQPKSDIWTVELKAGERLSAAVDTSSDADVRLSLVAPDGCLISWDYPEANCSGGGYCSSLEYDASETGTYSLIAYSDWCEGSMVSYQIGAMVE